MGRTIWASFVWGIWLFWAHWGIVFLWLLSALPAKYLADSIGWPLALLLVGVADVGLLALYLRRLGKIEVVHSIFINRPVAEVFQFIAADYLSNRPRWQVHAPDRARLLELMPTSRC